MGRGACKADKMTRYTGVSLESPPRTSSSPEIVSIAISLATCAATIAELSCGAGERANLLSYNRYYGFDSHLINILAAKQNVRKLNAEFSIVDVLRFQSDLHYQTVLALGGWITAANIDKVLVYWQADFYVLELIARPFIPANITDLFGGQIHYSQGDRHLITLEGVW